MKKQKRKAIKVEELSSLEAPNTAKEEYRIGPLGIYEPFTYTNYEWSPSKKGKTRFCVLCSQPAQFKLWFQQNGYQKIEELCR